MGALEAVLKNLKIGFQIRWLISVYRFYINPLYFQTAENQKLFE